MRNALIAAAVAAFAFAAAAQDQPKPARTILAVGAHAGDMELTCGALLLKETQRGDRVVILHLTLGESFSYETPADFTARLRHHGFESIIAKRIDTGYIHPHMLYVALSD